MRTASCLYAVRRWRRTTGAAEKPRLYSVQSLVALQSTLTRRRMSFLLVIRLPVLRRPSGRGGLLVGVVSCLLLLLVSRDIVSPLRLFEKMNKSIPLGGIYRIE